MYMKKTIWNRHQILREKDHLYTHSLSLSSFVLNSNVLKLMSTRTMYPQTHFKEESEGEETKEKGKHCTVHYKYAY